MGDAGNGEGVHFTRRQFVEMTGAAGVAGIVLASAGLSTSTALPRVRFSGYPFTLGVASGDPQPNGIVLWTRLAPDPVGQPDTGGMPTATVPVDWEVAQDRAFRRVVRRGTEVAVPELAYSVHAEVTGLAPGREYFYRFRAGGEISPTGRTKTAAPPGAPLSSFSFAVGSCQSWVGGRYAAYRDMADHDLDLMVHLGDYIYEHPTTRSLTDYRGLHALYKTSPDLQAAHAAFPFAVTFDDHEVSNNWAGDIPQHDDPEFLERRANAFQAYYEHMPLRMRARPVGPDMRLHRKLTFGNLVEFNVLDTRQYRDDQACGDGRKAPCEEVFDPDRTLTGPEQEQWYLRNFDRSAARWNILAQQAMVARYDYDTSDELAVNLDQWDGYVAQRDRLLGFLARRRPANPVILSGDWHVSMVNDLTSDFSDPSAETVATEFLCNSISSGAPWASDMEAARGENPHVRFFEGYLKGYLLSKLTQDEWRSDFRVVWSPSDPVEQATTLSSWVIENGRPGAMPA